MARHPLGIAWKLHWSNFPHRDLGESARFHLISSRYKITVERREEATTALCASRQFGLDQYDVDYFAANPSHFRERREAFHNTNNSRSS
jgi:hypothetical protein